MSSLFADKSIHRIRVTHIHFPEGSVCSKSRCFSTQVQECSIKTSKLIFSKFHRILFKKFDPFLIWFFLSSINKRDTAFHGLSPNGKRLVSFTKSFKLGSVPTVLIVVAGEIHPHCIGW